MSIRRRDLERGLARAERTIALVDRCRPLGLAEEWSRVRHEWSRGNEIAPSFVYAPTPSLEELRAGLESVAEKSRLLGGWGALYADRAAELSLEATLGARVGTADFPRLAALRHPVDVGPDGAQASRWAAEWTREPPDADPDLGVPSDDGADSRSLLSAMRKAVGELRLPFRVLVSRELLAAAATGEDVILVRAGARYRDWEVERIVQHEIVGHALPRARARSEALGLFALGTARGSDDEEGRALLAERRAGCLGARRRAELGRRHLAALSVRQGADWVETARQLRGQGASLDEALVVASRVHRGGGLGRELVYLVALSRVARAIEADPTVERWLERGRVAVDAVPVLRALGEPPEVLGESRAA